MRSIIKEEEDDFRQSSRSAVSQSRIPNLWCHSLSVAARLAVYEHLTLCYLSSHNPNMSFILICTRLWTAKSLQIPLKLSFGDNLSSFKSKWGQRPSDSQILCALWACKLFKGAAWSILQQQISSTFMLRRCCDYHTQMRWSQKSLAASLLHFLHTDNRSGPHRS